MQTEKALAKEKTATVPLRSAVRTKLNVIVLDNPVQHGSTRGELVSEFVGICHDADSVWTKSLEETLKLMKSKAFDLVIIHHADFPDADAIRSAYPKVKLAAYSGNFRYSPNTNPNTLGYALERAIEKHYDFLIFDEERDIPRILEQISADSKE
jgi:hypothetical protein